MLEQKPASRDVLSKSDRNAIWLDFRMQKWSWSVWWKPDEMQLSNQIIQSAVNHSLADAWERRRMEFC